MRTPKSSAISAIWPTGACVLALRLVAVLGLLLLLAGSQRTQAQCLFTNGDFETTNLTGWTVYNRSQNVGNWFNYTGVLTPISNHDISAPPQGTRAVVSDHNAPTTHELYQDFTIPAGQSATLSFRMAYNNTNGFFVTLNTLDWVNNQQLRIDLLKTTAANETVAASDIWLKLFQTQPGDPLVLTPTLKTYDLSGFAGMTLRLRFAEAVGLSWMPFAIDTVCLSTVRTTLTRTTPTGANVSTDIGDVHLFFPTVTAAGTTSVQQLDPAAQTGPPAGITFAGPAFDISTAATYTGSATVCFYLPNISDPTAFSHLRMLHKEGGIWVQLSSSAANFPTRQVCGVASSLSPFAVGTGSAPTSAAATIKGQITAPDGFPVGGTVLRLSGGAARTTISDSNGNYSFENLSAGEFYSVTPGLVNYHFAPASRSFSLVANETDAPFAADADTSPTANAIDSAEYFVRQHYLDFLGREPDQDGLEYWSNQINQCNGDAACIRQRRIEISGAFFMSGEFQDTGSYVYDLYAGLLGRTPDYGEFTADRAQVVGGSGLDAAKSALAQNFVHRSEFTSRYPVGMGREEFVDAVLQTMQQRSGVDLTSARAGLLTDYDNGGRPIVVRHAVESSLFVTAEYNKAFVLMEYFGYLRRGQDPGGYDFWLNTLNQGTGSGYRGMVCSFLTSAEYQQRFGVLVTHSNQECAGQ